MEKLRKNTKKYPTLRQKEDDYWQGNSQERLDTNGDRVMYRKTILQKEKRKIIDGGGILSPIGDNKYINEPKALPSPNKKFFSKSTLHYTHDHDLMNFVVMSNFHELKNENDVLLPRIKNNEEMILSQRVGYLPSGSPVKSILSDIKSKQILRKKIFNHATKNLTIDEMAREVSNSIK
jgi:hypothetical protein